MRMGEACGSLRDWTCFFRVRRCKPRLSLWQENKDDSAWSGVISGGDRGGGDSRHFGDIR